MSVKNSASNWSIVHDDQGIMSMVMFASTALLGTLRNTALDRAGVDGVGLPSPRTLAVDNWTQDSSGGERFQ